MSTPRPAIMADLTDGARVRHIGGDVGVIRVQGVYVEFHPDDFFGVVEVGPEGPFFPSDLEILGRDGRTA